MHKLDKYMIFNGCFAIISSSFKKINNENKYEIGILIVIGRTGTEDG